MQQLDGIVEFGDFALHYRDIIYDRLTSYMPRSDDKVYNELIRTYTDRKGKYTRPSYLLLWCLLYGGKIEDAILPAAAQQASEDWILIHDDIMDGNSLRRGKPAAHVMYGEPLAINAGDGLHAVSWKIAIDAARYLGDAKGQAYLNKFYDIIITTHMGQHFDISLTSTIKDITKFTVDDYYRSIYAKSAYYSVYGPMQAGALIAGAGKETIDGILKYGAPAGLAFQIMDDVLDCTSTEATLGKSIGNDVRDGAKTLILHHAVQNASTGDLARLKKIYMTERSKKTEENVRFVLDKFVELGSIGFARKEAERLRAEAAQQFEVETRSMPESRTKELARSAIGHTTSRSK